jgi:carbamoyl-phosphate synthase large subunit
LGGSDLQLDLILEAKKMFFYTIVLDVNKDCIGAKWCDEFLNINIVNKEEVLNKAKEYRIDSILTSATEQGNITSCYVGEKLGLNTNSYQTSLETTDKIRMKKVLEKHNLPTAKYKCLSDIKTVHWREFPCIVKPADSSAGRGLSYCTKEEDFIQAFPKALRYSHSNYLLIEEYIDGDQFSIETISCNGEHQIIAINNEFINDLPNIMEVSHKIPSTIDNTIKENIKNITSKILNVFSIKYGACHIEVRVKADGSLFVIEIASRTGGMRSEMINLAYGISYSQLLLLSSLNSLSKISYSRYSTVKCNFLINYKSYIEYLKIKEDNNCIIFEPFKIPEVSPHFYAEHIGESKGYYFILDKNYDK